VVNGREYGGDEEEYDEKMYIKKHKIERGRNREKEVEKIKGNKRE
jgi:hypothetical protein